MKPPLTLPLIRPLTVSSLSKAFSRSLPGREALGLLAGQAGFAEAVLDRVQGDLDLIADRTSSWPSSPMNWLLG